MKISTSVSISRFFKRTTVFLNTYQCIWWWFLLYISNMYRKQYFTYSIFYLQYLLFTVFFIYSILEHDFLNQYFFLLLTTKEFLFKSSWKFLRNVLYILLHATFNSAHAFTFYTHCPMEVLKKSGSTRCYNTLSRYEECRFHAARIPRWYGLSFPSTVILIFIVTWVSYYSKNTRYYISCSIPYSYFIMQRALQLFTQCPFRVNVVKNRDEV